MMWMFMLAMLKEPGLQIVVEEEPSSNPQVQEEKKSEAPLQVESSCNTNQRPLLGVYDNQERLTDLLKEQLGISHGWIVGSLSKGGPAEKAGLRPRDIITSIDGREVHGFSDVQAAVRNRKPGDTLTLELVRGGRTQTLQVTLGSVSETRNEIRVLKLAPERYDESLSPEQKLKWLKNRYQLDVIPEKLDDVSRLREMLKSQIADPEMELDPEDLEHPLLPKLHFVIPPFPKLGEGEDGQCQVTRLFVDSTPEGTVMVSDTNGAVSITIRTNSGEEILKNGTPDDAAKLPAPWPEKVQNLLNKMK
ncbi:MAG: S1C family serine protease [Planctomycetota bacterium]